MKVNFFALYNFLQPFVENFKNKSFAEQGKYRIFVKFVFLRAHLHMAKNLQEEFEIFDVEFFFIQYFLKI